MNVAVPAIPERLLEARERLQDYLELTKPRLTSLVLLTTAAGFWLGVRSPEQMALLWPLLIGTALSAGGAHALNQFMERAQDTLMQRTQRRPLPSGRLQPAEAQRFGLVVSGAGIVYLTLAVNGLTGLLSAICIASYLFLYTPMKRRTPLCTLVGAIPGAIPPMMGWTAARGALGPEAWALFMVLFVWQLPHFLAIAALFREDYARAGFQMLPLTEPDGAVTARQTVLYGLVLVPVSLVPTVMGLAGELYFYGALALSLTFLAVCVRAALWRSPQAARALFRASILYLPLVLMLLAVDKRAGL